MYYQQNAVLDLFNDLISSGFQWLLPWTISGELPSNLPYGKDVDILTKNECIRPLSRYLTLCGYSHIPHPYRNDVHLYGTKPPLRFLSPQKIPLDITSQVCVRSLDAGQWIPIHENLHASIWNSALKTRMHEVDILVPSTEDILVCVICRSIFNKRTFSKKAQAYIRASLHTARSDELTTKLALVFYSFAPYLLALLESSLFDEILPSYLSFSNY